MVNENEFDFNKFIQTSPDITLENPPEALFAKGNKGAVDLYGALSIVAMRKPDELVVFDPIEERQMQGIYDDTTGKDPQIEDLRFIKGKMDNEDPEILKSRIIRILNYIEKKKFFLHGTLELEANAFESSLFVDVKKDIINKLEGVHRKFRDGKTFPKLEKGGILKKHVKIRFIGRAIGRLWPRQDAGTGRDFLVNLNEVRGFASGIVVVEDDVAEFVILTDTVISKGNDIDWIVMRQLLKDFQEGTKTPICWFKWQFGLDALFSIWGFENIKEDMEIKQLVKSYNERISETIMEYYKDAKVVGTEEQVDFNTLPEKDKELVMKDLMETMDTLTAMLDDQDSEKSGGE
ncbi:hypothetical protein GF325_17395 [Candidatus Bathyarchaeota archaeon]|nr:hypothetical protein [Candidatus Bathyarchaeota archaeon]